MSIGSGTDSISTQADCNLDEHHSVKIGTSRPSSCAILILGLLGLYSFSVSRYLCNQQELSLIQYGESDATLRRCVDSADGLWTPQENYMTRPSNMHKKNASVDFRILCTSVEKRIAWGSYKLRCNDLKRWVDVCVPNVDITVGVSIEQLHERWSNKPNETKIIKSSQVGSITPSANDNDIYYDSTIFIKSMSKKSFPQFGNKFVDLVDEYNWKEKNIPREMHLILQTKWQGQLMYPNHTSSVVEHWYNSYPSDMVNDGYPEYVPSIVQQSSQRLHIATIWNTRRSHDPSEGGCPTLSISGVKYDCVDKDFDITAWYLDLFKEENDRCQMVRTMAYPQLGPGMLYYNVFRKFDALVVLAKNDTMKLEYGNVQRAISQMRSGVPVLLEIRGRVFEEFMDTYNYSCAFRRYNHEASTIEQKHTVALMTFDEAVEKLKDPEVRRDCQRQGLEIVKDYSPSKIGQKFLKTVGYEGNFLC
eukprot:CAMPEP_0116086980 /NCGR_PEP_ID=MMETSP0327-20121206/5133_1 /TAXON_ID=44447 /ORGANISM="Pseudo-nitzschia delicatissima, Strain B596" /LENGTH=474 /DNA_ID=CAMNT_0003578045 /DNA_START=82 /DNA_END=1506 /DNA_ORIENTATION=+